MGFCLSDVSSRTHGMEVYIESAKIVKGHQPRTLCNICTMYTSLTHFNSEVQRLVRICFGEIWVQHNSGVLLIV